MFYSHEVLTNRKYGVATVWIIATMGAKSAVKKVTRKAILEVNVPKTCETIERPEAPLALRLQGNLLYGVTKVYGQQCGYVLNDVEHAHNGMRAIFKVLRTSDIDADGGHHARSDQLILPDDPAFIPDLTLVDLDMNGIDVDLLPNGDSQQSMLSPGNTTRSHHSPLGIDIPASASSWCGGPVGGFSRYGSSGTGRREERTLLEDDLGLEIADDGAIIVHEEPAMLQRGSSDRLASLGPDSAASKPRSISQGVVQAGDQPNQPPDDGFDLMQYDDDQPVGAASSHVQQPEAVQSQYPQVETTSETVDAPIRKKKVTQKVLPLDQTTELRNSDFARWNTEYLANMAGELQHKHNHQAAAIAKKNALWWMLQQSDRGPLSMFTGARLLLTLTGVNLLAPTARKRPAEDELSSETAKRMREEERPDEVGRGQQNLVNEDDGYQALMEDTIEQGRDQPTPLDDRQLSGIFPWNQSTGSRRPTATFGSVQGAQYLSSISGGGTHGGLISRRGSRLVSQSPLLGRGLPLPGDDIADDDFQLSVPHDSDITSDQAFELYGAAAQVDTQTAAQSQWVRAALDAESVNFLAFVKEAIAEHAEQQQLDQQLDEQSTIHDEAAGVDEGDSINFETLLPPATNSKVVAAQGLLHVLTLGTKRLLYVQQEEAFESITLRVLA